MVVKKVILPILLLFFLYPCGSLFAEEKPALLPLPKSVEWGTETFNLNLPFSLVIKNGREKELSVPVNDFLEFAASGNLKTNNLQTTGKLKSGLIFFQLVDSLPEIYDNPEGYSLTIDKQAVTLKAVSAAGIFYGVQTLRQLYVETDGNKSFRACKVIDYPAFSIRGFMHDVGRSFISVESLKQQVKILSFYKINTFHWHLTEDIAWRLQSRVCPELTDTSCTERFKGKYYSQEEVRSFVSFCKTRNVTVIPEIDMPGHSAAFRRATGFEMQSAQGRKILTRVLAEACRLFDTPYIHLGSDEVKITDPTFMSSMRDIVRQNGKTDLTWMPGAVSDSLSIKQMWMRKTQSGSKGKYIDSRLYYLNHNDPFADLMCTYNSNICNADQGDNRLLGGIVCTWNDRKLKTENDILLANGFYPAMLAFAERCWIGKGEPAEICGTNSGTPGSKRFQDFIDFENRLLVHKQSYFTDLPFPYVRQSNISWRITDAFPNNGDLTTSFPPEFVKDSAFIYENQRYSSTKTTGAAIYFRHTWGPSVVPGFFKNPQSNSTAYAFTWIFSPRAQSAGLWIGFHNYGRSETDFTPEPGKWDYKESMVKINDSLVKPPLWKNAGNKSVSRETEYVDEPFEMRPPTRFFLQKGWNYVLLKLPVGQFSTKETRLVKWMFTFVIVNSDKNRVDACPGLVYDPDRSEK